MPRAHFKEALAMAKKPSKSPAEKIVPEGATQKPTPVPLPRGADPAGQAVSTRTGKTSRPDPDQVAQRAYERYQSRGGHHGGDQDDWYAAEQELSGAGSAGGHK
jgi:hypothetical protein